MQGEQMIPHPSVVRERLARNLREGRILRTLLTLSVRAVETLSGLTGLSDHGEVANQPKQQIGASS
jgi:hypothetical protein